jgi:hypothetical protein
MIRVRNSNGHLSPNWMCLKCQVTFRTLLEEFWGGGYKRLKMALVTSLFYWHYNHTRGKVFHFTLLLLWVLCALLVATSMSQVNFHSQSDHGQRSRDWIVKIVCLLSGLPCSNDSTTLFNSFNVQRFSVQKWLIFHFADLLKLTSHLHMVPTMWMRGVVPRFLHISL